MRKPNRLTYVWALGVALAALFTVPAATALAEGPVTMAPPISAPSSGSYGTPAADSVFNWNEVPADQDVPIERAVFDQGGYQLFDTVGETIVVPFKNDDLYVMKFAVSPNGNMFFVNTGSAPVLYVPRDGYLENATVPGARWYPFSARFHPATPVYEGCAPSWSVFIGMGWYPGMCCYGGYWCGTPLWEGGVFVPCIGLAFVIGGHHYWGWGGYADYWHSHPHFYHTGWFHRQDYRFAARSAEWRNHFGGTVGRMRAEGFVNRGHGFEGAQGFHGGPTFHGAGSFRGVRAFHGGPAFRGVQSFHGAQAFHRMPAFHGADHFGGGRNFSGAGAFHGSRSSGGFEGGHASFGGGHGGIGGGHGGNFHGGGFHGGGPGGGGRHGH